MAKVNIRFSLRYCPPAFTRWYTGPTLQIIIPQGLGNLITLTDIDFQRTITVGQYRSVLDVEGEA